MMVAVHGSRQVMSKRTLAAAVLFMFVFNASAILFTEIGIRFARLSSCAAALSSYSFAP
jgi:hypothetical protein